jgi:3-deoxy-D-manno-octulosonic-acid transferase
MLEKIHTLGVQTHADRDRLLELGAKRNRVTVTGNLKFDYPAFPAEEESELLQNIRNALRLEPKTPVVVIGSSMKGEDPLFLEAFMKVRRAVPATRLLIAPRHPERFNEVAQLISDASIPTARRSRPQASANGAEAYLLDTIGELRDAYSIATVVVIGGSFISSGGHNLLEPAALGKAILFGPDMSNFREIAELFLREKAARQCTRETLATSLIELIQNDQVRIRLGQQALTTLKANRGAAEKSVKLLLSHID